MDEYDIGDIIIDKDNIMENLEDDDEASSVDSFNSSASSELTSTFAVTVTNEGSIHINPPNEEGETFLVNLPTRKIKPQCPFYGQSPVAFDADNGNDCPTSPPEVTGPSVDELIERTGDDGIYEDDDTQDAVLFLEHSSSVTLISGATGASDTTHEEIAGPSSVATNPKP